MCALTLTTNRQNTQHNVYTIMRRLICGDWLNTIPPCTDILLFQSGWGNRRVEKIYSVENPGIHPDVGLYLRENLPSIRMIGIDWISISPYQDRELGREAHRVFLDQKGRNNPVLLIEDIDLSGNFKKLKEVWVSPLRVERVDSAPCTVIGDFSEIVRQLDYILPGQNFNP